MNSNHPARVSSVWPKVTPSVQCARGRSPQRTRTMPVRLFHGQFGFTASFLDRARWLHGVRHANPDGCRATKEPFCPCVKRYSFSCRPAHQSVWFVAASKDLSFRTVATLSTPSRQCKQDQLPRSDLIAHAPTQDTDKSSASHHCNFKGNDQVDSMLALATLATSEQEEPASVRPGMATFTY